MSVSFNFNSQLGWKGDFVSKVDVDNYMVKSCKNRGVLISIIVFILLYCVRLLQILPYYHNNFEHKLSIITKENTNQCLYDAEYYRMIVPECIKLQLGRRVEVLAQVDEQNSTHLPIGNPSLSSLTTLFDKEFEKQKSLMVTSMQYYHYQWYSPKDWLWYIEEKIQNIGSRFTTVIDQNTTYSTSWLILNSILGYVAPIPEAFKQSLSIFGLQHVIAVSGFHISFFIIALQTGMPKWVPRNFQLGVLFLFIFLYWLLVGLQPSVNRAVTMSVIGIWLQRVSFLQVKPFRLLVVTAASWLLIDPLVITSVSFQLSYLASLGIITFFQDQNSETSLIVALESNTLVEKMSNFSFISLLKDTLVVGIVAQVYTFPVIWYYFAQYPSISLLANLLFYWLPPLLIVIGSIAFLIHFLIYIPFLNVEVLVSILLFFSSVMPASVSINLLALGVHFEKTLLSLPSLHPYCFLLLLFVLALLTRYRNTITQEKCLPWSPETTVLIRKI